MLPGCSCAIVPSPIHLHMLCMSTYKFTVEQRPVPNEHRHGYVAIEHSSGDEIDLPEGGTGPFLGRYPEIAAYLAGKGVKVQLDYSRARQDSFDADHNQSVYTWTFNTGGGVVVVDVPRVVSSLTVGV